MVVFFICWNNRTRYLREKREQTNLKIERKRELTRDDGHDNNFTQDYATATTCATTTVQP